MSEMLPLPNPTKHSDGFASGAQPDARNDWQLHEILPATFFATAHGALTLGTLGAHAVRVAAYSYVIAESYGLDAAACARLRIAAAFHDIGKSLLPRRLLLKPGPLTAAERRTVEAHTVAGHKLLRAASGLEQAATVALAHHENLDGSGYPHGLRGDEIPLSARIVHVADVFDALTNLRPYHPPFDEDDTLELIAEQRGSTLDPEVTDAFFAALERYPGLGARLRAAGTDGPDARLEPNRHTLCQ